MKTLTVISTKGGVGKTTSGANIGGLVADAGKRVLLIDLDIQPTLSSYFKLADEANGGIFQLLAVNETRPEAIISHTTIPNLHLIKSNDDQNQLASLLLNAADGRLRLLRLLEQFKDSYDLVVIDTQGARSVTLEMALLASDIALSPVIPELLAAREFYRGTTTLFEEMQAYAFMGISLPRLHIFINRAEPQMIEAKRITESLIKTFENDPDVSVLQTPVPALASYRKAAALSLPAHRLETRKPSGRKAPAALDTMVALACEIFPEWAAEIQQVTPDSLPETQFQQVTDDDSEE